MDTESAIVPHNPLQGLKLTIRREGKRLISDQIAINDYLIREDPKTHWRTIIRPKEIAQFLREEFIRATGLPSKDVYCLSTISFDDWNEWYWCEGYIK